MSKKFRINITINREEYDILVNPKKTLLELLINDLNLLGTKVGCNEGECGACSAILNGKVVNSCLVLAVEVDSSEVITIEGVHGGRTGLHPIQRSFIDSGAVQCGYCTPGMIMSGKYLIDKNPNPNEVEIKTAISGNLCRCTGYQKIIEAIKNAADTMNKE